MDNPDSVLIDLDHTLTEIDCVPAWKNMPIIYALGGGA